MGLINIFKKKAKDGKLELLKLPYDYDGYDMVFKKGVTNPKLYGEFNEIITNNKLSIEDVDKYNDLEKRK